MLTNNISLKNFSIKSNNKKTFKNFKNLLKEDNQILKSLKKLKL